MTATGITVGIIDPSEDTREVLRIQVDTLGLASVKVESAVYCISKNDRVARQFIEASPDIILVDMHNHQAALQTLQILHAALPECWFFVISEKSNPDLIIETMRTGAREFFPKPLQTHQLSQAVGRFISAKQRKQKDVGKLFCFTGAKGGVGATTLSINVAASLSEIADLQISFIDLSIPVGDAAANLNLKPQFTIAEALESASRLDGVLLESFMSHSHGVSVLPSPKEFKPGSTFDPEALAKLLDVSMQTYTHTIIDLTSTLDKENLQVVAGLASSIIVVLTPELPVLMVTERMLRFFGSIGITDKLKVVLNRNQKTDEISITDIEKALKHSINWKVPNNYKSALRAINSGQPVVSANHSELASSFKDFAHWLAEIPPSEKRGLFSFLKR